MQKKKEKKKPQEEFVILFGYRWLKKKRGFFMGNAAADAAVY